MPTTVIIKQGVNPYSANRDLEENKMRKDFNRDHPAYLAPGIADGTWECETAMQERKLETDEWEDCEIDGYDPICRTGYTQRQIWRLTESKEGEKTGVYHDLKTIQPYFNDVGRGVKNFEIRKYDRDFKVGDKIILYEYVEDKLTGAWLRRRIIYILRDAEQFGLMPGYCILGLENIF